MFHFGFNQKVGNFHVQTDLNKLEIFVDAMPVLAREDNLNFVKHFLEDLHYTGHFSDVTLVCDDGKQFKSHKAILSQASEVLRSIFSTADDDDLGLVIFLPNSSEDVGKVLDFVYLGGIEFDQSTAIAAVAEELGFIQLKKVIKSYVKSSVIFDEIPKYESRKNEAGSISCQESLLKSEEKIKTEIIFFKSESEVINDYESPKKLMTKDLKEKDPILQFKCISCEKSYTTKGGMRHHYKTEHEGFRFPCSSCDKEYKQREHLRVHVRSCHEGIFFKCKTCDQKFTTKVASETHHKQAHEGIRYSCSMCNKEFRQKAIMIAHINAMHLGVKIKCKFCRHESYDTSNLSKHVRNKHPEEWKLKLKCKIKINR